MQNRIIKPLCKGLDNAESRTYKFNNNLKKIRHIAEMQCNAEPFLQFEIRSENS